MKCPKCRAGTKRTRVTHTQHCSDHTIRYCRCLDCGNKWKTEEKEFGVDSYDVLKNVMDTIKKNINEIKNKLETLKSEGKKVIGYGATAKFTQVSNMCELNSELIDFVVDTTPNKHNKYIPKSNIKILPYDKNILNDVDYCYLGAWNFKDEILEKEKLFLNSGGKFITHIPDVRVV